jgi:hypothetical protein
MTCSVRHATKNIVRAWLLGVLLFFTVDFYSANVLVENAMPCKHQNMIRHVTPSAKGCEDCLRIGSKWFHLRVCRSCGYVGCCDSSPNRHARKHFEATKHPVIEGYDPAEGWGYCFVDNTMLNLSDQTPQIGPIPRYYLRSTTD